MTATLPTLADSELAGMDEAGFGAMQTERGCLPLVALDVTSRVEGLIASTEICQTFVNAHDQPLEATYLFPLPDRAAVTHFRLEVAGRVIEGELQEKGQARREYQAAVRAGHRAAIAEEERAGVFTVQVGNLPVGEEARVQLTLTGPLPCENGEVTFRFPLVVAPRYIPGIVLHRPPTGSGIAADTTAVPDASRISPPVLLPGLPNPVRLCLTVEVSPALWPAEFRSSLHTVRESADEGRYWFRLHPGERLDRDFVLRWKLGGPQVRASLITEQDEGSTDGTFLLTLMPPCRPVDQPVRPREIVFVLDRSGSMSGWKMITARRAVARMVETLRPCDRFTIYAFDDTIQTPPGFDGKALVAATDRRRFQAAEYLANVTDAGGTEMEPPLKAAVEELNRTATDADRILVLITDGQVGNEDQILRSLAKQLSRIRVFTLGIDRSVNAAFLQRLATLGGGSCDLVESDSRLDEVMDHIHRRIGTPELTGLTLRPQGMEILVDSLPYRLPDLFASTPVVITGRYRGNPGAIAVSAHDASGRPWSAEAAPVEGKGARFVWARGKVRELEDRHVIGEDPGRLQREIVDISLRFGVLSRFTAFVAVDRVEKVNPGGEQLHKTQPVETPSGWGISDALSAQIAPVACATLPPAPAAAPARHPAPTPPFAPQPVASMLRRFRKAAVTGSMDSELPLLTPPSGTRTPYQAPLAELLGDLPPTIPSLPALKEFDIALSGSSPLDAVDGSRHEAVEPNIDAVDEMDREDTIEDTDSVLGGGREVGRVEDDGVDRQPLRPQAEALLYQLRQPQLSATELYLHLRSLEPGLTQFVQAIVNAGDTHETVGTLFDLLFRLQVLVAETIAPDLEVELLYGELIVTIENWLALTTSDMS